mgnify:CR=1 FL=1
MEDKLVQQSESFQYEPINEPNEPLSEPKESEKSSTWSVKLYEADRMRLMNLLDVIPMENRREAFMDIVAKAEVATAKEQAATGFVAELEKYTKAIMQSAVRQVSMYEAAEAAYKGEAQQRLDVESQAKEKYLEEVRTLQGKLDELKDTIHVQKEKLDGCADELIKKKQQIDSLKADLESARRSTEAVAEIQKDYDVRLRKAESLKFEAEADKLRAEDKLVEVQKETEAKLKALSEDFEVYKKAAAGETSRLSSALSAAEAVAAAREAQITQLASANAQLMGLLAAAQEKLGGTAGKLESSAKDGMKESVEDGVKESVKNSKGKNKSN